MEFMTCKSKMFKNDSIKDRKKELEILNCKVLTQHEVT